MCGPRKQQGDPAFDPQGPGYDYASARAAGFGIGEDGHWPSRAPLEPDRAEVLGLPADSGLLLKGEAHPTYAKGVEADKGLGYAVMPRGNRNYTVKY